MSSFVISKREYVKAAGLVAGISEVKRVWVYDYEMHRNTESRDYYRRFVECYEMNAISVAQQYHDSETETDPAEYADVFAAYKRIGRIAAAGFNADQFRKVIFELRQFFSSAVYQTEFEPYFFRMKMFFNEILVQLMEYLQSGYESKSWGELVI